MIRLKDSHANWEKYQNAVEDLQNWLFIALSMKELCINQKY